MRFAILCAVSFSVLGFSGCPIEKLDIDKCMIMSDPTLEEWCTPMDKNKPEYSKPITIGDICVSPEHNAKIEKHYKEVLRRCGDKCK